MQATIERTVMVQGRIVWTTGDTPFKGKLKVDQNTKQPKLNQQGEQIFEYGFGLAVPKTVLNQTGAGQPGEIWAAIHEAAFSLYPSRQVPPGFAWKYKDGDGVDHNGVPFAQREGHAGHLIFACTTAIPIKFFRFENGQNIMISDGIKCGDYVNVQLSVKAHPAHGQGKPGLYLNPYAVQFMGYGKEIINTPSGDQIFGLQAPPLPPGASATPVAQPGMIVPPSPMAAPQQSMMPPVNQQQPHYGVLPPTMQPQGLPASGAAMPGFPAPGMPMGNAPVPNVGMPPVPGFPR